MSTDFLDVPDAPGQSSSSSGSGLPPLKLRQNERDPPRIGAKLQEIQLTPTAGFVIKTTLQTYHAASGALPLTKLFINVSSAPQIPPPPEGGKVNPLCAVAGCEETLDKAGNKSLVIEATLNPDVLYKSKRDKKYKQWLIQWVLEKVEEKMGVDLGRNYGEPNIKSKGSVNPRTAVLPIPVVHPSKDGKIAVIPDDEIVTHSQATLEAQTASNQRPTPEISLAVSKPRHEFEIVDQGSSFVLTLYLPDEIIPSDSTTPPPNLISLALTDSHVSFKSPRYTLETSLPLPINVADVQTRGGAEWSRQDSALRVTGTLLRDVKRM